MIDGMSHRNSKNVGKLEGKDAKGEERKGTEEKERLYYHSEEGKKKPWWRLSKGNKTRLRSYSDPHPKFLTDKWSMTWRQEDIQAFFYRKGGGRIQVCFQPQ